LFDKPVTVIDDLISLYHLPPSPLYNFPSAVLISNLIVYYYPALNEIFDGIAVKEVGSD